MTALEQLGQFVAQCGRKRVSDDVRELVDTLYGPEQLSAAGIGPDDDAFRAALEPLGAVAAEAA